MKLHTVEQYTYTAIITTGLWVVVLCVTTQLHSIYFVHQADRKILKKTTTTTKKKLLKLTLMVTVLQFLFFINQIKYRFDVLLCFA